jgi:DNA-binding NtrC family response regulator
LQSKRFDLLISDVEPGLGLSARKILAMAGRTKSSTAVVLMTDSAISKSPSDQTETAVLIKPFTLDDVATIVRRILDSRS